MASSLLETVVMLTGEKRWKEVIEVDQKPIWNIAEARKLLWVWPSEENLNFIQTAINEFHLNHAISIGCGCGLFEWIIQQYSGIPVTGIEVNKEWWRSKYSNPQFIPLEFIDDDIESPIIENILSTDSALIFCYFNNGDAFIGYVKSYKGPVVIIIGPGPGAGRYTDPEPFKANFGDENSVQWKLFKFEEVKETKDFIAIYVRKNAL